MDGCGGSYSHGGLVVVVVVVIAYPSLFELTIQFLCTTGGEEESCQLGCFLGTQKGGKERKKEGKNAKNKWNYFAERPRTEQQEV